MCHIDIVYPRPQATPSFSMLHAEMMDKYNFSHDTDTLYTSLHTMIIHFYWYVATIHM